MPPGHICMLVSGTRGDVQPLLALAQGLQQAGYPLRFVTHARYRGLVEAARVPYAELDGDTNPLFEREAGRSALVLGKNLLESAHATHTYLQAARPLYARMLRSAWQQCHAARAVIGSLPTDACGSQIAEALGVPYVQALLQPVGPTRTFPTPLQPSTWSAGGWYNRLSHNVAHFLTRWPWRAELADWRRMQLGLGQQPRNRRLAAAEQRGLLALYGMSRHVVPRPADWPAWRILTGYWFLARPHDWQPNQELVRFLASGPPPVYVGPGAMGIHQPGLLALVIQALRLAEVRGVLAFNEAIPAALAGPDMLAVGPIWHDWLFPQLQLAIHHGGAGTTATALRAGIPSLGMPVGVDQFFWCDRVAALGCGPPVIALRAYSVPTLAQQIDLARSSVMRNNASKLGELLHAEDGVTQAVMAVRGLLGPV